ncbi:hypothetical protein [Clostridium sp. JN-9]|uniref:hypothetical protein n=1 Tax=Clostridium sp. JN-9 TaxID=2507159 RepID=UPI0013E8C0FA|nr:hypothetical protein [Clostridium sp. JN-9]
MVKFGGIDYTTAYNIPVSALQLNVKILSNWLDTGEKNDDNDDEIMKLFRPL